VTDTDYAPADWQSGASRVSGVHNHEVVRKRGRGPSSAGRLSWDGRLWDRVGRVHLRAVEELDRAAVLDLLRADDVEVVVSSGAGRLRWLDPGERMDVWTTELAPQFHDRSDWRPPATARGQLPYHAELWRNDEARVLLFTDRD
jgi:hypothetical protein